MKVKARNAVIHGLKAIIVSSGSTRFAVVNFMFWTISGSFRLPFDCVLMGSLALGGNAL